MTGLLACSGPDACRAALKQTEPLPVDFFLQGRGVWTMTSIQKSRLELEWKNLRSCADDLRKLGLKVAVHNDYSLNGVPHTFWLMTVERDGLTLAFKGEGETDQDALDQIRAAWAKLTDKRHHAPMCPANHYHGQRAPTYDCTCGAVAEE